MAPIRHQQVIKNESQSQQTFDAGITQDVGFSQPHTKPDDDDRSDTESEGSRGLPQLEQSAHDGEDETMEDDEGQTVTDEDLAREAFTRKDKGEWEAEGFRDVPRKGTDEEAPAHDTSPSNDANGRRQAGERSAVADEVAINDNKEGKIPKDESQPRARMSRPDQRELEADKLQVNHLGANEPATAPLIRDPPTEAPSFERLQEKLKALEWDGLYKEFGHQMTTKTREEEGLKARFQNLSAVGHATSRRVLPLTASMQMYLDWASTPHLQEEERAAKRLRTRIAFVQHQQKNLRHRQDHRNKVTEAFQRAIEMLST